MVSSIILLGLRKRFDTSHSSKKTIFFLLRKKGDRSRDIGLRLYFSTIGETISEVTTDESMDVNQPDNIKPQQRSKSKKSSKPRQSPVNIELKNCVPLYIEDPLTWYSYGDIPLSMMITNWNDTGK